MARPGAWRRKGRGNGTHAVGMIEAMERPHFVPYDLLIPFDFLLRHGLRYDLAFDVPWRRQSGGIACGLKEGRLQGKSCGWVGSMALGLGPLFWRCDMMPMRWTSF